MSKRILKVLGLFLGLFILVYSIQNYFINKELPFSLLNIYLFHLIAAIIVYVSVELVFSKLPNQAGYAYLTLIFIKIGAFVLIFQQSVFANDNLMQLERVVLVVPLFVFLIVEAICISKLLNNQ